MKGVTKAEEKHHTSRFGASTIFIWAVVILLGFGVIYEGISVVLIGPDVTDPNLKIGIFGLGLGVIGIGVSFVPLGLSEISGIRDARKLDDKLDDITKRLKEIESRLPK
jgi:hypothetical protein